MNPSKNVNYSKVIYVTLVIRKHFFMDKLYNLYVLDTKFVMVEEEYGTSPKYVIPFNLNVQLKWIVDKSNLIGFTIRYNGNDKNFYGQSDQLYKLKELLGGYFFYNNFKLFYSYVKSLGEGSFGKVAKYQNQITKQSVAVKMIKKQKNNPKQEDQALLLNEISILKSLDHPNILKLFEVYQDNSNYYLVTEFLEGLTLKEALKGQSDGFSEQDSLIIVQQILQGLEYLHKKSIIHRDLKLTNIMFSQQGIIKNLKIIDFGLSVYEGQQEILFPGCGTVGYMAPEIANYRQNKQNYNEKSDIFSVGCIFFKLLTKKNIIKSNKQNKTCNINIENYIGKEWQVFELIKYMVKKNPEERIGAQVGLELITKIWKQKIVIEDELQRMKKGKVKRRNNSNTRKQSNEKHQQKSEITDDQTQFQTQLQQLDKK